MAGALDEAIVVMAREPNFAALTVLLRDGTPMTHVMWVDADDDHVLINTEVHRAKFKAIERDPRATVTVIDRASGYHYAEVRGRVVDIVLGQPARDHIDALSQKYNGRPYPDSAIRTERALLRIRPDYQRVYGR